jgi:hypothetical protein
MNPERVAELLTELRSLLHDDKSDPVQEFLLTTYHAAGEKVLFSEFYDRFISTLQTAERYEWTKRKLSKNLRRYRKVGFSTGNKTFVFDTSFNPPAPPMPVSAPPPRPVEVIPPSRVRYVEISRGDRRFYFCDLAGKWSKTTATGLRLIGATGEQLEQFRARPITISDLLARYE